MNSRLFSKVLSVILVVSLFVTSSSLQSFAQNNIEPDIPALGVQDITPVGPIASGSIYSPTFVNQYSWGESLEDVYVLGEIQDFRTESSKTYKLSNGVNMVLSYGDAIHKKENGQWKDITTNLSLQNGKYVSASDVEISIPQDIATGTTTLTHNGYSLSLAFLGQISVSSGKETRALATKQKEVSLSSKEKITLEALSSSKVKIDEKTFASVKGLKVTEVQEHFLDNMYETATYKGVFNGVDLEYVVTHKGIKESIVIESLSVATSKYAYSIETDGVVLRLQLDNTIIAYSNEDGTEVFRLSAPYLEDSNGDISTDIVVTLTETTDNTYILQYNLPHDWLRTAAFPVVLDPTVSAVSTNTTIEDIGIAELNTYTDAFTYTNMYLRAGKDSVYGTVRSFVKFNALPYLTSADVVVDAKLKLYNPLSDATSMVIDVHKVTENWTSSTNGVSMNWSTQPDFSSIVQDYQVVTGIGYYEWDITDIARDWFATGNNTGIAITAHDESTVTTQKKFYSSDIDNHMQYPLLTLFYINNTGLESYWDYTELAAERAGTGYINHFSGNLVWVHQDLGYDGNRAPVSVYHVYNANDSLDNRFGLGYGWRTNYNQLVYQLEDYDIYVWEDEDGTRHYFEDPDEANVYTDTDGLGLTLAKIVSGTSYTYTITDSNGNVSKFDKLGRLVQISDNQTIKSYIYVNYKSSVATSADRFKISSIEDGVAREYMFSYSSGLLSYIKFYGITGGELNRVSYYYDDGELSDITYSNGAGATYFGYGANHLLRRVMENCEYRLNFTYNTTVAGLPNRITKVQEADNTDLDSETTEDGGYITFKYGHNETKFTDRAGRTLISQFNYWGNTICTQDSEGNATYYGYSNNTANSAEIMNQLRLSSNLQNTVGNKISQPNVLNYSKFWTEIDGYTGGTRENGTVTHTGTVSIKLTRTSSNSLPNAMSGKNTLKLEAGESATFSAYVNAESITTSGFYLVLGTSITTGAKSEKIRKTEGQWERFEVTYTNTENSTVTVTPYLLLQGKGTVYVDSLQLEKTTSASRYNYVYNGDFSDGHNGWDRSSGIYRRNITTNISGSTSPAKVLDVYCYKAVGNPNAEVYATQTISISGLAGDSFVLSGWARGDSAPLTEETNRTFEIRATVNYTDGSEETTSLSFNPDMDMTDIWQYVSGGVYATKDYSSIDIAIRYDYNVNEAYFDGIQLFKEGFGAVYGYGETGLSDDDLDMTSMTDANGNRMEIEYENNLPVSAKDTQGNQTSYVYDTYGNLTKETDSDGVIYEYDYNSYGQVTQTSITNPADGTVLTSSTTYTTNGNYITSETDTEGNTTTYDYDQNTGLLKSIQYPEDTRDTRTEYVYDSQYNLISTRKGNGDGTYVTVDATYTSGTQTGITHSNTATKSTTYTLQYYNFDIVKAIKVGTRTLASYTYTNLYDRNLASLTYGNGATEEYVYDSQGRVIEVESTSGTSTKTLTYTYDSFGNIVKEVDTEAGVERRYKYSESGSIIRYTEKTIQGNNTKYDVYYVYNNLGQLTKEIHTVGGNTYTYTYTYDSNGQKTGSSVVKSNSTQPTVTEEIVYDELGRLEDIHVVENGDSPDTVHYSVGYYEDSNRVQNWRIDGGFINHSYIYSYDDNGNITEIAFTSLYGNGDISYSYDALGQLIRVNDQTLGTSGETWTYAYDLGGNITSKSRYAYTTGTLGTVLETITYTYGDASWGDLLTSYNGQAITYDQIGNPLSDGTWTYTWEYGRQLATQSSGNTTWTYDYDASGQRITRTDGNTTYEYGYYGSTLVYEKITQGDTTVAEMYITYGEAGPLYIEYNGIVYYYILNGQGAVVGLREWDVPPAVLYTYNAWGELESITGNLASTLGVHNPLRYRGYVYDTETEQYYLNSRYYNPEWGRFVNADDVSFLGASGTLLSYNLFSYCENNPVNYSDESGNLLSAVLGGIFGGVLGAVMYWIEYKLGMRVWNYWVLAAQVALNASLGAIGAHFRYWAKFANLAKLASRLHISQPLLKTVISLGSRGITFAINAIVKSFTRLPGESWIAVIKRYFGW